MPKRQGNSFALLTFVCAIVLTGVLLFTVHADGVRGRTVRQALAPAQDIAVEHDAPMTLTINESTGKARGIVEFSTEGTSVTAISVPSTWERREVRGAALSAVTSDLPNLGFTRWHLPLHVTVSFWTADSPALNVRNVSPSPLLILGKRVNVVTGRVEERSVLVKEGAVRLW